MRALPPFSEDAISSPLALGPQLASGRQLARREEMSILRRFGAPAAGAHLG